MRLSGKVIIVTGSGRGLGKSYAVALAKEGANLVISDILRDEVENTASEIRETGGKAIPVYADVSRESDANNLAAETARVFGRIDVLVNNAAIFAGLKRRPFYEIPVEEWDNVTAVNIRGPWLCTKAVFPFMKKQGGGKIINISSSMVFVGVPGRAHYLTSKAAIVGLTRALCKELGTCNITINALAPGYTLTEAARGPTPDLKYEAAMAESRALKRNELPNDLIGTMLYLCSSDSDFVTGQTIVVDGGRSLH